MAEYTASDTSSSSPGGQLEPMEKELRTSREALRAGRDQAMDEARVAIRNMVEDQKARAAQSIDSVAHALHETARSLGTDNQDVPARYTNMAAEQLERMSTALRDRSWEDLVQDAQRFARSQPTLFIGGAVAAGFFLARFLKSVPQTASAPVGTGQSAYGMGSSAGGSSYSGSQAMGGEM